MTSRFLAAASCIVLVGCGVGAEPDAGARENDPEPVVIASSGWPWGRPILAGNELYFGVQAPIRCGVPRDNDYSLFSVSLDGNEEAEALGDFYGPKVGFMAFDGQALYAPSDGFDEDAEKTRRTIHRVSSHGMADVAVVPDSPEPALLAADDDYVFVGSMEWDSAGADEDLDGPRCGTIRRIERSSGDIAVLVPGEGCLLPGLYELAQMSKYLFALGDASSPGSLFPDPDRPSPLVRIRKDSGDAVTIWIGAPQGSPLVQRLMADEDNLYFFTAWEEGHRRWAELRRLPISIFDTRPGSRVLGIALVEVPFADSYYDLDLALAGSSLAYSVSRHILGPEVWIEESDIFRISKRGGEPELLSLPGNPGTTGLAASEGVAVWQSQDGALRRRRFTPSP